MTFKELLAQTVEWLQQDGHVSYRSVKWQFDLDEAHFEDLKEGLLYTHGEKLQDNGQGLVWIGGPPRPMPDTSYETDSEIVAQSQVNSPYGICAGFAMAISMGSVMSIALLPCACNTRLAGRSPSGREPDPVCHH